jgi:hypothetical protein
MIATCFRLLSRLKFQIFLFFTDGYYPLPMESGGGYCFGVVRPSILPSVLPLLRDKNHVARGTIGNWSFSLMSLIAFMLLFSFV